VTALHVCHTFRIVNSNDGWFPATATSASRPTDVGPVMLIGALPPPSIIEFTDEQ
jgi:hypothetical protein